MENAKFVDGSGNNIQWTDANGAVWKTTLDGDGEIPEQVRVWVARGNVIASYVALPEPRQKVTKLEALEILLIRSAVMTKLDIDTEMAKDKPLLK